MGENDAAGNAADFGAGITDGVFDHAEADDDADMRAVAVGLAALAGTKAANLAVEDQPFFPIILFLLFERGDLFVLGHTRHESPSSRFAVVAGYHSRNFAPAAEARLRNPD
jgi:hypothetical protein